MLSPTAPGFRSSWKLLREDARGARARRNWYPAAAACKSAWDWYGCWMRPCSTSLSCSGRSSSPRSYNRPPRATQPSFPAPSPGPVGDAPAHRALQRAIRHSPAAHRSGILVPRTRKPALAVSIVWAPVGLVVRREPRRDICWRITARGASRWRSALRACRCPPLANGPYPRTSDSLPCHGGPLGRSGGCVLWLTIWGSFCYFLLLPANRSPEAISQIFSVTDGQPGWLTAIMNALSALLVRGLGDLHRPFSALRVCRRRTVRLAACPAGDGDCCRTRAALLGGRGSRWHFHRARNRP